MIRVPHDRLPFAFLALVSSFDPLLWIWILAGCRPGKIGGVFAGIPWGLFRAEYDRDGRGSFAAV